VRSPITTHILDTALGRPAAGVAVVLERCRGDGSWSQIGAGTTDADGRVTDLLAPGALTAGRHRIRFDVGAYHEAQGVRGFYPHVDIAFRVDSPDEHYHVPLLLNPFGFSTYRGS
jgi:5-hydroxyisourate hydrolase